MTDHCSDCGAELKEGSKFCLACKKKIEKHPVTSTQSQQQPEEQHEIPKPSSTIQKSKRKLIIGISIIIIAAIIVLIIIVNLPGGFGPFHSADSRFIGEWEQNTIDNPFLWKFNSDSTLKIEASNGAMTNVGTWKANETLLFLYNNTVCYSYEFSNRRNTLTLNLIGESENYPMKRVLTKKGEQATNQTPTIECTPDPATNRITITSIDGNVRWRDIVITTNPSATWQVQDADKNGLAKIGTSTTISTYVTVGDNILVLVSTGDVTVTLKYIPTNALLGNWTVNV